MLVPLEFLNSGDAGDVVHIDGDPQWLGRMQELGIAVGSRLCVLRSGSPCLLQVGESRLSLRGDWAMQILVRPVDPSQ